MREYVKRWQLENREKMRATQRRYHTKHREEISEYKSNRLRNNIQSRLASNLRSRLRAAIKNNQKVGSAIKDLGCSIEYFKEYLENKFTNGMSWNRFKEIHIDHILPLSKFDLTNREHFLKANHFTNLQPLWKMDNILKSDKVDKNRLLESVN